MDNHLCYINSLTYQVETTARVFCDFVNKNFNDHVKGKITLEEYVILDTFVHFPHLNKNSLAKTAIRDIDYIDKIISKLIKKKLLKEVKSDASEIQVKYYELTEYGEKIYIAGLQKQDGILAVILKFITEKELVTFVKTLLKIRNIILSLKS